MKILIVSPEMDPFVKVGGLADVVGSLPFELSKLGIEVKVVIPYYKKVKNNLLKQSKKNVMMAGPTVIAIVPKVSTVKNKIYVCLNDEVVEGEILKLKEKKVEIYFLKNDEYYNRDEVYNTPQGDYPDNYLRFAFLSYGALRLCEAINYQPDIIHFHDWQSALIPVAMKNYKTFTKTNFFKNTKTILTIHNLAYQGCFSPEIIGQLHLPFNLLDVEKMEYYGKLNFLKGGIVHSDAVTTVSPTYAQEITTKEYGCGLEGLLQKNKNKLYGIINGIDYNVWNPQTDKKLSVNFSENNLSGKQKGKENLQKELKLKVCNKPLVGIVSRLVAQKGMELVVGALQEIMGMGFQLVILGTGEEKYHKFLQDAGKNFSEDISLTLDFNDTLARKIYASSDFFLVPSRFEPCGLTQMIALRYGSIPVVRKTGGLADTIIDYTQDNKNGNGFVFTEFSSSALIDVFKRAKKVYEQKEIFNNLILRALNQDFSWSASSKKYVELFEKIVKD